MTLFENSQLAQKVYELHRLGLSDRAIGEIIGKHHNTVAYYRNLRDLLPNGSKRKVLVLVGEDKAICNKCGETKDINCFRVQRSNAKYPYRLTYCTICRSQQQYANQNNTLAKYFKDRLRRLKTRCDASQVRMTLTTEFIETLWREQKGMCFYSDWPLRTEIGKGYSDLSFSIDRVIPGGSYVPENVVLCCYKVNSIKNNLTMDLIKSWLPDWYRRIVTKFPELEF